MIVKVGYERLEFGQNYLIIKVLAREFPLAIADYSLNFARNFSISITTHRIGIYCHVTIFQKVLVVNFADVSPDLSIH